VKLSSLEKRLFLASVTCIHLKTVNALSPYGSYAGVHSDTDGHRKSAETISKVLKIDLTINAVHSFFSEVYQNAEFVVILSELCGS
jgi:hypothetical protein